MRISRTACIVFIALNLVHSGALADEALYPVPRFTKPDRRAKLASALPEIERLMADRMAADHIPGMAFGVVIDGELAFGKGLGVRDLATGAPVDLDTAFRIA